MAKRSKVTVEMVQVTPKKARGWLEGKGENRNLSPRLVARYRRDMELGQWDGTNGSTIVFNGDGTLVDGQHRLQACIEANRSFQSLVVFGASSEAFETIDTGKSRSTANIFAIRGVPNYAMAAAVARMLWLHEFQGNLFSTAATPSPLELQDVYEDNPDIQYSIRMTREARHLVPASMLAALHYLFKAKDKLLADSFMDALATGENLGARDPVYQLRERLIENKGSRRRLRKRDMGALIIKAWNFTREGKTTTLLKWAPGGKEPFPEIR